MTAFKTIYFSDYPAETGAKSGLTVAFNATDDQLFKATARLSSFTIREAIGHDRYSDVQQAAERAGMATSAYVRNRLEAVLRPKRVENYREFDNALQSTFTGGKGSPLHDWFPYLEGYSPEFVQIILETYAPTALSVLDPFCGSGTTAITSAKMGLKASYCEVNPVCRSVIKAKTVAITSNMDRRRQLTGALEELADGLPKTVRNFDMDPQLAKAAGVVFGKRPFFDDDVFHQLLKLRSLVDALNDDEDAALLAEVAVMGALVANSRLVRRGDLRFKTDAELKHHKPDLLGDVQSRLNRMAADLGDVDSANGTVVLACNDARFLHPGRNGTYDAIVTSPPYLNGTNYFRNTKVELWFGRHLKHKDGLRAFRDAAITSGINDVTNGKTQLRQQPSNPTLGDVLRKLEKNAYDQRIPKMVASYFAEMSEVATHLVSVAHKNATIAIDLGDSCYGDVFVPTDVILREIMADAGCKFLSEVVLRERQSRSGRPLRQTLQIFQAR